MRLIRLVHTHHSLYVHTRPIFHKALELGCQWDTLTTGGLSASLRFNTRGDHAGLKSWLELGKLLIEFSIYDHRHWNVASKAWMSDLDYLPQAGEDELDEANAAGEDDEADEEDVDDEADV